MLREELLRSKNDEIARCLVSRKRKLSELYFATVGFAGATENTPPDSLLYHQKEQAFLDANDLSKGRYFNEATLPPLPDYAALIPRSSEESPSQVDSAPKSSNAAPISPPGAEAPASASQAVARGDGEKAATLQQSQQTVAATGPEPQKEGRASSQPAPGITPEGSQGLDVPTPGATQPSDSPASEQKPNQIVPEKDQGQRATDASVPPAQTKPVPVGGVHSSTTEVLSTQKKHDKRPSLALGRSVQASDQPLSPVSSAGPYSNNTPIPVTASPDTSPAEEMVEPTEKVEPTPKPEEPASAPPTLVPSTPDEQLRLEEAQSLQKDTIAASKAIGGSSAAMPSTNEVIQENVEPTPTDSKRSSQPTPVLVPPVEPEPKRADGVVVTAEDTQASTQPQPDQPSEVETASRTLESVAPAQKKSSSSAQPAHPERMTTRVSSGAIRHKSVSEILGETPKASPPSDKGQAGEKTADSTRLVSDALPESPARLRFKDRKAREKERSKPSTVVFLKQQQQQQQQEKNDSMDLVRQGAGDLVKLNEEQDYLFTLFQNKAYTPPRGTSLSTLLASSHKTLTTANHFLDYQEQMDCRTLRRIYQLQNANRWPLRQLKRSLEPPRQGTHWDALLDHMKWMRTDFREERKWKIAAAKSCADWCAEYVHSDPEHRSLLRVPAKIPRPKRDVKSDPPTNMISPPEETGDEMTGISHPTPDLVPSTEEDSVSEGFNDEPRHELHDTVAPAAIFSLGSDEFTFSLDMTPAAQKLLEELPVYEPVKIAPESNLPMFKEPPDASWKTEILPVSKYAFGKIKFHDDEPPRKRSRYDYSQYDSDPGHRVLDLPPEQTNVALFQPENKHIRDRIHPGHQFRPPTEHPMPSVGFFESRQSSQWTYAEDEELRRLVKEYSYNWSLISSCLTPSSQFTSAAERRTPWECFERWVGLEGLPADMSKTQYFRAYHQRLETAQRTVLAQQQAAQQQQQQQQQQQGNNGQSMPPIRRRTTQPLRVDRRRSSKHLALLDAMRKLAKKRETMLQKQQHASQLASLRKANEANQPKPPISSPAEFSRLKHERELKMQERHDQFRAQMMASRANAARNGQMPNQQGMMNGAPARTPNALPQNSGTPAVAGNNTPNPVPNGVPNGMPNGMPAGVGVNQGRPQMQGMPNTGAMNSPMPPNAMAMKMMPQSGMQQTPGARPGMPMQTSPDNARVIREANRLQEQQRILHGMVPTISGLQNQIQRSNPNMTPEQVNKLATERLHQYQQQRMSQVAMNAAAGNMAAVQANYQVSAHDGNFQASQTGMNGGPRMQMAQAQGYSPMMRVPQNAQHNRVGVGGSPAMNGAVPPQSRSGTPQTQRSGSAQAGPMPGSSKSPNPQAQTAGS
ncbi:chromatin modification-related protein VID21 [Aspergillus terreus]